MDINSNFKYLASVFAAVWVVWKYVIERKDKTQENDFTKMRACLCDYRLKNDLEKNPILRMLYFKNIKHFNKMDCNAIEIIIKFQNFDKNFNNLTYQIEKLYRKKLIVPSDKCGFELDTRKASLLWFQRWFIVAICLVAIVATIIVAIGINYYTEGSGLQLEFPEFVYSLGSVIIFMVAAEVWILNQLDLIKCIKEFKEATKQ
ncbi:hypothetical protein ACFBZI_08935 [Moraxella sp. ZJ142]|uniref:hypothetical protein n=1 Tax=Moraxella marmotae TaxID=3344520 RepID=UPI0035D4DA40